jgi:hypothetical protein
MFFAVDDVLKYFGGMQKGLRRNTANVEAGAAEDVVLFDERDFQSELRGFNCGDVASWARANNDEIKL